MKTDIRKKAIATGDSFASTYNTVHWAEKGVAFMESRGIFPLTLSSPQMPAINRLGLYSYYSGAITVAGGDAEGHIIRGEKEYHLPREEWEDRLGFMVKEYQNKWSFSKNGAYYARLLHSAGWHTITEPGKDGKQRKASVGSRLPPYLCELIDNYDRLTKDSRTLAGKYLRDVISVWFDTKGRVVTERGVRVRLLSQPTEEDLREQAEQLVSVVNSLYPNVGLDKDRDINVAEIKDPEKKGENVFGGYVSFSLEKLLGFPANGATPVKFDIRIEPRWARKKEKKPSRKTIGGGF
ncbi:MAG: hypothetical protein KJ601_06950 [Nanoarchaeota archaeon]|nr:hypothetical protein [Nanoarchaeota archaeon]MBU1704704.1 hypothetical protein [Nanoarchaeota archaeon]